VKHEEEEACVPVRGREGKERSGDEEEGMSFSPSVDVCAALVRLDLTHLSL